MAKDRAKINDRSQRGDRDASGSSGSKVSRPGTVRARSVESVPNSESNLSDISAMPDSDGQKYQYAVQLAKQDLGGDTSDDEDFRNLVDEYYAQMDPTTSAEDMRGESDASRAIRGVGEFYDGVNDTLGDGIDWLWDNVVGNAAGGIGSLVDAATNGQTNFGDDWRQGVSDVISPETADAIASMGTGMLVSAIPGVGVPLSIGLTAAQNSDDIYEAITGRDAISLEELDGAERLGRAGSALLDTALAAAPAVGKLGRGVRGAKSAAGVADDLGDAANAARRAAAGKGGEAIQEAAMRSNALRQAAGDVARGEASEASAGRIADLLRGATAGGAGKAASPARGGVRGAIDRIAGSTLGEAANPVNQARALARSVSSPGSLARSARAGQVADAVRKAASRPVAEAAKGGFVEGAKNFGKNAARNAGGAIARLASNAGTGGLLNYLNYMGQTGDASLAGWGQQVANPANVMMMVAPTALRRIPGVNRAYGKLGLSGLGGQGAAGSVRARGIGNNVQPANDPGLDDDELRRRIQWQAVR